MDKSVESSMKFLYFIAGENINAPRYRRYGPRVGQEAAEEDADAEGEEEIDDPCKIDNSTLGCTPMNPILEFEIKKAEEVTTD